VTRTVFLIWTVLVLSWTLAIISINSSNINDINFWFMVVWINILITINIFIAYPLYTGFEARNSNRIIGALPGIGLTLFIYSLVSGFLAFSHYFLTGGNPGFFYNYHLTIQVILFAAAAVPCLFMVLAGQGAESGARGLPTREDLLKQLNNFISINSEKYDGELKSSLDDLIEYISYKMPHPAALDKENYSSICKEINSINSQNDIPVDESTQIFKKILINIKTL
jgi:hypothetical protein